MNTLERCALDNTINVIKRGITLPDFVFNYEWDNYFFMTNMMIYPHFINVLSSLFKIEGSARICFNNISLTDNVDYDSSYFIIDGEITREQYFTLLKNNSLAFVAHTFSSMSNVGEWCMYFEGDIDLGIFAIRNASDIAKYSEVLELLSAGSLDLLTEFEEAYIRLPIRWKEQLYQHYS